MSKRKKKTPSVLEKSIERVLHKRTDFATVEMYKTIRTNIMFSLPKSEKGKVILITSATPNEGKTTTSINIAITFAQLGAKVLLVDCDLRRSRVHRYLRLESGIGVSNVLCGFADIREAIQVEVRENLDVLMAGATPPNPAELLGNVEFETMIGSLKQEYDYIFIDTPPVNVVTDALVVANHCDGIVVVVRENQTTFDSLDQAMDSLRKTETSILGAIVSGCESKTKKYGYYRKGKYGYGYGYGE